VREEKKKGRKKEVHTGRKYERESKSKRRKGRRKGGKRKKIEKIL
jgi:hypothetical protein